MNIEDDLDDRTTVELRGTKYTAFSAPSPRCWKRPVILSKEISFQPKSVFSFISFQIFRESNTSENVGSEGSFNL